MYFYDKESFYIKLIVRIRAGYIFLMNIIDFCIIM